MSSVAKASVIIPCFNEERRVIPITNEIKKSKLVSEIIIVDDGSNRSTKNILKNLIGISIITHSSNLGKSRALKSGVLAAKSNTVAFIDADLKNFTYHHLNALTEPVLAGEYDITLSDREKEIFYNTFNGFSLAFTGDRCFRRNILLKHINVFNVEGYLIEAAINKKFFNSRFRIVRVPFKNVGQYAKYQKIGDKGWIDDLKMFLDIVNFLGLKEFVRQIVFAKNLSPLE